MPCTMSKTWWCHAPYSRDNRSWLSSGHVTEECGLVGTKAYLLHYQASDGCAIGKHFFNFLLCCCRSRVVDTCREEEIVLVVCKSICNLIILTKYMSYTGGVFRYIGCCLEDLWSDTLAQANVRGLWSIKVGKSLPSRK